MTRKELIMRLQEIVRIEKERLIIEIEGRT